MELKRVEGKEMNRWLVDRHYLHRPVIRTKTLGYEITEDDKRIGGILWATPHFQKKHGLFGFPGLCDKWEVLILSRFYIEDGHSDLVASHALASCIGKRGNAKSYRKRGWRVQQDWCDEHPPRFPDNPFVPRLLMSWSDMALEPVAKCESCGQNHNGKHEGHIYRASGWTLFDVSKSSNANSRSDFGTVRRMNDGEKRCWILHLPPNPTAYRIGLEGVA